MAPNKGAMMETEKKTLKKCASCGCILSWQEKTARCDDCTTNDSDYYNEASDYASSDEE